MAHVSHLQPQEAVRDERTALAKASEQLKYTETTRYLCAAAHLNKDFRKTVFEQLLKEDHKAIGEWLDTDILTVVKHCLLARRREIIRNSVLCTILLLFSYFLVTLQIILCLLCPIFAWAIVFLDLWICHFQVVAKHLTRSGYDPDAIALRLPDKTEQKIKEIQNANVVIYSGFSPFIGSGNKLPFPGWHLTTNITKGKQDRLDGPRQPLPFELSEMYEYITRAISELHISGLSIKEKLYIHGEEIRDEFGGKFLEHPLARPRVYVNTSLVKAFIERPTQSSRYYLCFQVMPSSGELVLSMFVNLAKEGPYLHAHAEYYVLPPLKETFYEIDALHTHLRLHLIIGRVWQLLKTSISTVLLLWVRSPLELGKWLLHPLWRRIELFLLEKHIRENRKFDYGARNSIREDTSDSNYRRYFHKLDVTKYLRVIERHILQSAVEFLDMKNIDTGDLKKQQTTILNAAMIMTGGTLNADNLAVGDQAMAGGTIITDSQGGQDGQEQSK